MEDVRVLVVEDVLLEVVVRVLVVVWLVEDVFVIVRLRLDVVWLVVWLVVAEEVDVAGGINTDP